MELCGKFATTHLNPKFKRYDRKNQRITIKYDWL